MFKSTFLRRMLLVILATLMLSAALIALVFTVGAQTIFAQRSVADLEPKAEYLSSIFQDYLYGWLPPMVFAQLIDATRQWGASILCLRMEGNGYAVEAETQFDSPSGINITSLGSLDAQIEKVMSGERVAFAGVLPDSSVNLLMVGRPVYEGETQIGAVFLFRPMLEVNAALQSLNAALFFSMFAVLCLMIPVACVASMRLIRPLKNMRDVALTMASGDFTIQANEYLNGEVGELAHSLNYLAFELSRTISELVLERNRLMRLVDGLSEGMAAVDSEGFLTHANPALMRFFSLPEDAPLDELLIINSDFAPVMEGFRQALSAQIPYHAFNIALGSRIFLVSISTLETEGRVEGAVALLRDITESERLEQTRRDYVANVSHELRTPLTALRGLIEPLNDGLVKTEQDRSHYYQIIYRETLRLSRLIDDLLELSRLQSGGVLVERKKFDIVDLIQSFIFTYSNRAEQLGIEFTAELPDAPLYADSNADRVEQVLVILFDNALKFTPEGGKIELCVRDLGGDIELMVKDSGVGISKEDLPSVFDRFYKADKAHGEPGTGLGLSIAKEIIRLMGGRISVESEEGKGAAFKFTIAKKENSYTK